LKTVIPWRTSHATRTWRTSIATRTSHAPSS
jgi:hypothetical protein